MRRGILIVLLLLAFGVILIGLFVIGVVAALLLW